MESRLQDVIYIQTEQHRGGMYTLSCTSLLIVTDVSDLKI